MMLLLAVTWVRAQRILLMDSENKPNWHRVDTIYVNADGTRQKGEVNNEGKVYARYTFGDRCSLADQLQSARNCGSGIVAVKEYLEKYNLQCFNDLQNIFQASVTQNCIYNFESQERLSREHGFLWRVKVKDKSEGESEEVTIEVDYRTQPKIDVCKGVDCRDEL